MYNGGMKKITNDLMGKLSKIHPTAKACGHSFAINLVDMNQKTYAINVIMILY